MCEGPEAHGQGSERKSGGVGKGCKWNTQTLLSLEIPLK